MLSNPTPDKKIIHLIGFGSQGAAWAQCMHRSGWQVEIYLRNLSTRGEQALALGFTPKPLESLAEALDKDPWTSPWVAALIPDDQIGAFYERWLRPVESPITLFLAHGYSVFSGKLGPLSSEHSLRLFAPKCIGPKLVEAYNSSFPQTHTLAAAVSAADPLCLLLGSALGFSREKLIPTTFETETIGDLISEQLLLCGGLAVLLEQTWHAMRDAGVPESLIREECITELGLIAGMLHDKGIEATYQKISPTALRGAARARAVLSGSGLKAALQKLTSDIREGSFTSYEDTPQCADDVSALRTALADLSAKRQNHT